ncbi:radical SAM protein [Ruegeria marisrubri]|uniref:radical SAM protein n=1 Tax=Ruegeria marisrubri TaxID=1685379 RepID=UPI0009EA7288|nr:radical SAM protein [Ruegeria marisrubri]
MRNITRSIENGLKKTFRNTPLRDPLKAIKDSYDRGYHELALRHPHLIKPVPDSLFITLTADCNLRCKACNYGRDFMPQQQLPWSVGERLIDDAKELGFRTIRLYGGEPLLHKDIERYVRRIADHGMDQFITTNGILVRKKIDKLVDAGLKKISFGYYGTGDVYDAYVQRKGAFKVMKQGVEAVRKNHGPEQLRVRFDFLLIRHTANIDTISRMLRFAQEMQAEVFINLVHYSLPYFKSGAEAEKFSFDQRDHSVLVEISERLIEVRRKKPGLIANSERGLRSIPDWLIKKERMKVPCTAYDLIWIGADGSVQLCYVTFKLGNLHTNTLLELLQTEKHRKAEQNAFKLNCPNCHCGYDARIARHKASWLKYSA